MKPLCAKTIKGVIRLASFFVAVNIIVRLLSVLTRVIEDCNDGESGCPKRLWMTVGISVGGSLFLYIAFKLIRRRLVGRF